MLQQMEGVAQAMPLEELLLNEQEECESTFHKITRHIGQISAKAVMTVSLVLGGLVAPEASVQAATLASAQGNYPDADTKDCSTIFGPYSWCKDENSNGRVDKGEQLSPRGYDYNNCTDWVAWRIPQLGVGSVPRSLGNGANWNDNAPHSWVQDTIPEPGDIAQSEATAPYGHVGVVEKVNKDAGGRITSIEISEYNKKGTGLYSLTSYTSDADGAFWRASGKKWDNFLDLNGMGKGVNNENLSASSSNLFSSSHPSAVARSNTEMDVFYRDNSGNLRNMGWNAVAGWGASTVLASGGVTGNPDAVARGITDMDVFYVDSSSQLHNIGWNAAIGWGSSETRAHHVAGDPTVITRSPTDMDVFYRDTNNNLVNIGWNANVGWGLPTIRSVGDVRGNPSAVARSGKEMEVVYKDSNNNLRSIGWTALTGWGVATTRVSGANVSGDPYIVSRTSSDTETFYRSDSNIYSVGWNANSGWGASTFRGGAAIGDPVATPRGSTAMEVAYQGSGNNLITVGWNATHGWGAATIRTNGGDASKPDIISRSALDMDIFFKADSDYANNIGWNATTGWVLTVLPGSGKLG